MTMSHGKARGSIRTNEEGEDELEDDDDDDDGETLAMAENEGEALIGGIESAKAELEEAEGSGTEGRALSAERKPQPFAHRDVKPVCFLSSLCRILMLNSRSCAG